MGNHTIEQLEKWFGRNLVNNQNLIDASINYEPYVYPVQFMDYKSETYFIKSSSIFVKFYHDLIPSVISSKFFRGP